MGQYTNIKKTAAKLVAKFGTDAIMRRQSTTDYPIKVVFVNYLPRDVDGQFIRWTDRKAIIAANSLPTGIVPDEQIDRIVADQDMQIVTVTKTSPGGDDIIYELQVRR